MGKKKKFRPHGAIVTFCPVALKLRAVSRSRRGICKTKLLVFGLFQHNAVRRPYPFLSPATMKGLYSV